MACCLCHAYPLLTLSLPLRLSLALQVGDLDGTVTSADLRAAFSVFGPLIDEETFVKANNGKYGFVRFQTRGDAERAKQQMNRKTLGSRAVRLGWGENVRNPQLPHSPHCTSRTNQLCWSLSHDKVTDSTPSV